jgi:PKD repeat protein
MARLNLPEDFTGGHAYQAQYGRRLIFAGAETLTTTLRVPARAFGSATLDALVSDVNVVSLTLMLDVGANGSWDWQPPETITGAITLASPNLDDAFYQYWVAQGSPSSGMLDVPVRVSLSGAGQVILTNLLLSPSPPDVALTADDITFGTTSPSEGETVPISVTLHNLGGSHSGALTAAFYATLDTPQTYIGSTFVPNIPPSGTVQTAVAWNTLGFSGTVPVRVVADPYGRLAEADEDNNEASAELDILTRPDLRVTQIALSDDEPVVGEVVTVTLTLCNAGRATASAHTVALYQGDPDDGGTLVGERLGLFLPGGATTTVNLVWTPSAPGPYRLFAQADRDDAVAEHDEGNNQTWRDVYVGFAGPILLDSGTVGDVPYSAGTGYGYVDTGLADTTVSCGILPPQTLRLDPGGQVVYRFDHLLPGHFYHLDLTLYECDGAGRQESVYVDGNLVAGPENLGDGLVHSLSLRLDPALYADHAISVTVGAPGIDGAVVGQVNLHDVDYRYADAGASQDPAYPGGQDFGWLDGVGLTNWGTLPYQSVRVNQAGDEVRYRFDELDPAHSYRVNLTFWQASSIPRIQKVQVDGTDTGLVVDAGDYQPHYVTVDMPPGAYADDGSVVVGVVRVNARTGAVLSEIALEQVTLVAESVPPRADFVASPTSGYVPLTVRFTDRSQGEISGRLWDLGDGIVDAATNPLHTYNRPGVYTVALTAFGPGGSDTLTRTHLVAVTALPPDATVMRPEPLAASAGVDLPLTLTMSISNVSDLGAFQFTMTYSPNLVTAQNAILGQFPGSSGREFTLIGPDIGADALTFMAFSLGDTPPGATGSGDLAHVGLLPQAAGVATLPVTDTLVTTVDGETISLITQNGTLSIAACPGDFDGDGDVDILDVQRVAYRVGARRGDPLYDSLYDLDADGDIDVADVQWIVSHMGTCQQGGMVFQAALAPRTSAGFQAAAVSGQDTALSVQPRRRTAQIDQVFTASVVISDAVDLSAFEFDLVYNPEVVEVIDVTLGDLPSSTGRNVSATGPEVNATAGTVNLGAYSQGAAPAGPGGDGTLVVLTLRALAQGESDLLFISSRLSDRMGIPQAHHVVANGMIEVEAVATDIVKTVTPLGQVKSGDELTYTVVISVASGTQVGVYDPLEGMTFKRFVEQPPNVIYVDVMSGTLKTGSVITGTLEITPAQYVTLSFVAQVGVAGTAGLPVDVRNRACVYPAGLTLNECVWSNWAVNFAFQLYLPLVMRE